MLEILVEKFDDLTLNEQENIVSKGYGKEVATYLRVLHNGEIICLEGSAIDAEDVCFNRDLSWVSTVVQAAYEAGKWDSGRYMSLPACKDCDGKVTSCWKLTVWERLTLLFTGKLWVSVLTFDKPLQPLRLSIKKVGW